MKMLKLGLVLLSAVAATAFLAPSGAFAAGGPDRDDKDKTTKTQPFSGKVEAVDTTAKTLTVDGKLIYVSSDTKLSEQGKAVMLSDIKVGDSVHGTTRATFDGKTEAVTIMVGKHDKTDKGDKDKPDKEYPPKDDKN